MTPPVTARVAAQPRPGHLVRGGLDHLREVLATPDGVNSFDIWRGQGMTKMFVSVLRSLAISAPPAVSAESVPVQYGMTLGLSLAAQIIEDPSTVVPGVFGEDNEVLPEAGPQPPRETFETPADGADE